MINQYHAVNVISFNSYGAACHLSDAPINWTTIEHRLDTYSSLLVLNDETMVGDYKPIDAMKITEEDSFNYHRQKALSNDRARIGYVSEEIAGQYAAIKNRKARRHQLPTLKTILDLETGQTIKTGEYTPIKIDYVNPIMPDGIYTIDQSVIKTAALTNKERSIDYWPTYKANARHAIAMGDYSEEQAKEIMRIVNDTPFLDRDLIAGNGDYNGDEWSEHGNDTLTDHLCASNDDASSFNWDISPILDVSRSNSWRNGDNFNEDGTERRCHFNTRAAKHGAKHIGVMYTKPDRFSIDDYKKHVQSCSMRRATFGINTIISQAKKNDQKRAAYNARKAKALEAKKEKAARKAEYYAALKAKRIAKVKAKAKA